MTVSYKRFFSVDQGLIPGCFNFVINGGIAWWLNREAVSMPLWGGQSVVVDTIATAFLLPLITCLIVTPIVAGRVRKGLLTPLPQAHLFNHHLPLPARSTFMRALVAGLVGVICAALPVVVVWEVFGPRSVSIDEFLWFKAGFAAILGAFITSLIAWWALIDASQRVRPLEADMNGLGG